MILRLSLIILYLKYLLLLTTLIIKFYLIFMIWPGRSQRIASLGVALHRWQGINAIDCSVCQRGRSGNQLQVSGSSDYQRNVVISAIRSSIQPELSSRICCADLPAVLIGAPTRTWITPGYLIKLRRGQYSPALCATGTMG